METKPSLENDSEAAQILGDPSDTNGEDGIRSRDKTN